MREKTKCLKITCSLAEEGTERTEELAVREVR